MTPRYQSPLTPEEHKTFQELKEIIEDKIKPYLKAFHEIEHPSEEEIAEYEEVMKSVAEIMDVIHYFMHKLGEGLANFSESLFIDAGIRAAKGNKDAQKFYDSLKSSYDAYAKERLGDRQN